MVLLAILFENAAEGIDVTIEVLDVSFHWDIVISFVFAQHIVWINLIWLFNLAGRFGFGLILLDLILVGLS